MIALNRTLKPSHANRYVIAHTGSIPAHTYNRRKGAFQTQAVKDSVFWSIKEAREALKYVAWVTKTFPGHLCVYGF